MSRVYFGIAYAQLLVCKDPSVNAKRDKNKLSVILVLGTRASSELRFHKEPSYA